MRITAVRPVFIAAELVRSAQTRVLSKSALEEFPMTQRLDYTAIAPAGIKALGSVYGYIVQSGLPRSTVAPIASICTRMT